MRPELLGPSVQRYFAASDALLQRVEPTWWGAVVSDDRFPDVYDLNYGRVDRARPDLTLDDALEDLIPAMVRTGSVHLHLVVFEPEGTDLLLREAEAAGHRVSLETVMEHDGRADGDPALPVEEADPADPVLWQTLRLGFREFDVGVPAVIDQLLRWNREVLVPAGRRWFLVRNGGEVAGLGALQVRGGVGYLDDVVTFPRHRRHGIASAIVVRMVREAREAGAETVFLLADRPEPIRLYRTLGFEETATIASTLAGLPA
jgi:GNAT superfamily N-acetyltransferase